MYSGNHSPCHPLDTLLDAARALQREPEIVFCFVGGGSEQVKVRESRLESNVKCLPYQPLNELSSSLSAADLHVVVMGEEFVGIVHPCKVYNILSSARRLSTSVQNRVTSLTSLQQQGRFFLTHHGDVDGVVAAILEARQVANAQPVSPFQSKHCCRN